MSFAVRGMGTAVPDQAVPQEDAMRIAQAFCSRTDELAHLLPTLYRQSGIRKRHLAFDRDFVSDLLDGTRLTGSPFLPRRDENDRGPSTAYRMEAYAEKALPLAEKAATRALEDAAWSPKCVTHLVTVSCTGFQAPGVDIGLIKDLSLSPSVQRVHVGFMGCHGAINGLRVASALAQTEPSAGVLLCAVELCTLHYFYGWDPKRLVANALFADGAAAVVGSYQASSMAREWGVSATGSRLFPDTAYAMTWDIGDHGFEMSLSTRVPRLIATHVGPWLRSWLAERSLSIEDIASWAVHPGGPRILNAVQEGLALSPEALATSREVLSDCGNMSSPTVLFVLERLRQRRAPRPCVVLGFGPGLVAEAALIE